MSNISNSSRFPTPDNRMVIGKRKDGASWRKTPRVVVAFQTTLSGPVTCPTCKVPLELQGSLWPCTRCDGVFVETAALEAMVSEMANEPWRLPPPAPPTIAPTEGDPYRADGGADGRPCPSCGVGMIAEPLATVAIDRCGVHGVWFDCGELASALEHIGEPPGGLGSWLKRLFFDP